jgi:hypothetical protein
VLTVILGLKQQSLHCRRIRWRDVVTMSVVFDLIDNGFVHADTNAILHNNVETGSTLKPWWHWPSLMGATFFPQDCKKPNAMENN